jgi:hypothetical protein
MTIACSFVSMMTVFVFDNRVQVCLNEGVCARCVIRKMLVDNNPNFSLEGLPMKEDWSAGLEVRACSIGCSTPKGEGQGQGLWLG